MDAITFLHDLVAIPSLSREEAAAVNYLVGHMQQAGFDEAFVDEAGNAVGIRGSAEAAQTIVLLGHIDTVPGDIPVRIENGVLHGRGSVDAKGSLATFVAAAATANIDLEQTRLIVIGAVEEESATSKGARHVATQYQPDFCIIGEPSGWDGVTLGYKGRILIDVAYRREMGHTAGQQSGVAESAIEFWNTVSAFVNQFNEGKPKLFDQLIPSIRSFQTGSDGLIDSAEIRIGIRLPPDFDIDTFHSQLEAWKTDAQLTTWGYEPAWQSTRKTPLARAFNIALRTAGARPRFKVKTGTSDMNVVGPVWNCPIVAYGPGDSTLDHTPHERLDLAEYERAIDLLRTVLESI